MAENILEVRHLKKWFKIGNPAIKKVGVSYLHACDDVSFEIRKGEIFGIIGESGSGKSTIGKCVLNLQSSDSGEIIFDGQDIFGYSQKKMKPLRKDMQMVFQNPLASFNPKKRLGKTFGNKPGCTIVDGPEGMNGQFKYGDRRNCTGWATLPIVGATWNHDVQTRFGEMYGEDALYASIPIAYAPGADTLRSPYSGRTSEYFSEDGVLSYYAAKAVSHGMRNKGLIGTVKHFFLNEQEAGRQGISTFANEQAIREIYMRAFEGSLAEGDSLGVMTAYNRIGVMYAAANQGIQHILRDEWNYGGYIIDDALTASEYSSAPEMLMAGNNIFCLDTARPNEIEKLITSTDDGDLLQKVIDSNHYLYYVMLQSSMGGSGAEDVVVSDAAPWWQTTLRALDVVFCALAVAAVVMYVLHTYTDVFSEEKRKNRAAKKN